MARHVLPSGSVHSLDATRAFIGLSLPIASSPAQRSVRADVKKAISYQSLLAAGADVFLAMPYELKDFKAAVDRCLPVQHLRRRSDPLNPAPVRIVVVDDEEWFVEMTTMLIRTKYEVALNSFTSSFQARDELQRTDPDMLIVGGVMPEISGEQIVRGLMARKITYPILVVSGYLSGEAVRGWFPDAPNIAFLQKPFTVEQLVSEVEKHFEPVPAGK